MTISNYKLSNNLTLGEVIKSSTACKKGIDNTPSNREIANLEAIAINLFQPVRDALGHPIRVSSGYRSSKLNSSIGGVSTSQHCKGEALDLQGINTSNRDIFDTIKNMEFDQLIWEFGDDNNPQWVHVSYTTERKNRNMILRSIKVNGKVKYKNITG